MKGEFDFKAYAYLLEGNLPVVQEIPLVKAGNSWTGSFSTNDTTKAAFITFSKGEIKDNNNEKGYYVYIYTATGDPVPGSRMMAGVAMSNFVGI